MNNFPRQSPERFPKASRQEFLRSPWNVFNVPGEVSGRMSRRVSERNFREILKKFIPDFHKESLDKF